MFQVKTGNVRGEAVATLWKQEDRAWVLVAYEVEPEFKPGPLPSAPAAAPEPAEPPRPTIAGDPAMQRAAREFLQAWFVEKNIPAAARYLSQASFECYNVYRPESSAQAGSLDEAGRLIQQQMALLAEWAGTASSLEEIIVAAEPHHPDLQLVKHDEATAYSIVGVPDAIATATDCSQLKPGETPRFDREGPRTYGRFYAVSLRIKRAGEEAGVLWLIWSRQGGEWTIVSYLPITP